MAEILNTTKVLRIDASMRRDGSVSRALADKLIETLRQKHGAVDVTRRDLASKATPFVDQMWIGANFTPAADRTSEQTERLALSDRLIDEIKAAEVLIIASPIYNFSAPAALKAWIDLVCRVGVTFRYTEKGPVGLLEGKRAYVLIASGGTQADSEIDFATPYLRHVLGFIGVHDVEVIAADSLGGDPERRAAAEARISELAA